MSATGVPFARLTRAEPRKQVDTSAGLWLILTIVLVTALVMVPVVWLSDPADLTFQLLAQTAVLPQMLLLPVVGIMAATSEWSQRTGLVTFALEPRRGRVILAKLLSAIGLGLLAVGYGNNPRKNARKNARKNRRNNCRRNPAHRP